MIANLTKPFRLLLRKSDNSPAFISQQEEGEIGTVTSYNDEAYDAHEWDTKAELDNFIIENNIVIPPEKITEEPSEEPEIIE
jgi:hypothetical protein